MASVTVASRSLHSFVAALFTAAGMSTEHAHIVADVLVWANLRGVDSHGVVRVPRYLDLIDRGDMNPTPVIRPLVELPAAALIDADRAAGPVAMLHGCKTVLRKARDVGIGLAFVRATTHTAALGYYTAMLAREGAAGIALSGSSPNMAFHGARAAGVSTGPISIAVPASHEGPLMLDMASSVVSLGRLMQARRIAKPLPDGWALDHNGDPTTDPANAEIPLPLGGAKGSGLSLMIECLTGLMVSNSLISEALEGTQEGRRHRQNGLVIAIDISRFCSLDSFIHEGQRLIADLKALPRANGVAEILMPGEGGNRRYADRSRTGIPIPDQVLDFLNLTAERRGIPKLSEF